MSLFLESTRITTDYFNIILMLQAGRREATTAKRRFARLWNYIYNNIEENGTREILLKRVIWMPAHCTTAAIGVRVMSNLEYVCAIDWRANRLVDFLARLAANLVTVPACAIELLKQFMKATEYCAASSGTITHAANNHTVPTMREDGTVVNRKVRDNNADQARERSRKDKRQPQPVQAAEMPPSKRPKVSVIGEADNSMPHHNPQPSINRASPLCQPVPKHRAAKAKAKAKATARAMDVEREFSFRASWHSRLDSTRTANPVVAGDLRMQAILNRIRGRSDA